MKKVFLAVISLTLIITLFACSSSEPIKIGFVGSLTGRFSDIGVPARNAVQLRTEAVNKAGGISGREIELIIKDSKGEADKALEAVKELNQAGVAAVIGPSLSNNALAILPYINQEKLLTMGTTITSPELSGKDDYFFRVSQTNEPESILQAEFLVDKGHQEVAAVLDLSNESYTEPWYDLFKSEYKDNGGQIKAEWKYQAEEKINHSRLAEKIISTKAEALVTVTSAMDTAMLAQQLDRRDYDLFFITSGWSKTEELLKQGGRTVEGIYSSHAYDTRTKSDRLAEFEAAYKKRFGSGTNFAANYAYDAAGVLFQALKKSDSLTAPEIKESLLKTESFPGLQDRFGFDQYGDVDRDYHLYQVIDGEFRVVEE